MKYTCDNELRNFQAWGGGQAVLFSLYGDAYDFLEAWSEEFPLAETDINDWLWFECEDYLREECGIEREDVPLIGAIFNCEENIQAAKDEIDSDLDSYSMQLEHNRDIAQDIIEVIDEKLKASRITGARELLRYISNQLEQIY